MTGNFVHAGEILGHMCQKPKDVTNVNAGAVWQCECSKYWQLMDKGGQDWGGLFCPPVWQRMSSREYSDFSDTQQKNKEERLKYGH